MSDKLLAQVQKIYQEADLLDGSATLYNKALELLEKLSQKEKYLERSLNLRWHIYYLRTQHDLALLDLDKLIKIDSLNRNAFYNRGVVKQHIKDYVAALTDFEQAMYLAIQYQDEDLIQIIMDRL